MTDLNEIEDSDVLLGDTREALLSWFKVARKTWPEMTHDEQQSLITGCDRLARHAIASVVENVTSKGFPTIVGQIMKVGIKTAISAQIDIPKHDQRRHDFLDAVGARCVIVLAEPELFMGERKPSEPDAEKPAKPVKVDRALFDQTGHGDR